MVEIIGFIALLLLGIIVVIQGLGMYYVVYGFSGRHPWWALAVAIIGAVIVYFTIMNAPFSLVLQ